MDTRFWVWLLTDPLQRPAHLVTVAVSDKQKNTSQSKKPVNFPDGSYIYKIILCARLQTYAPFLYVFLT